MKVQLVSNNQREPAPTQALGIVDVTGESIGLTERGVAFWEPVFRSRALPFSRVMKFEQFARGVQRFAATDCSLIPHIEAMAPCHAKGFMCASYGDNGAVVVALLRRLAEQKTRRVAFITKAAIGAEEGEGQEVVTDQELADLFTEEALGRRRLQRRLKVHLTRKAAAATQSKEIS